MDAPAAEAVPGERVLSTSKATTLRIVPDAWSACTTSPAKEEIPELFMVDIHIPDEL